MKERKTPGRGKITFDGLTEVDLPLFRFAIPSRDLLTRYDYYLIYFLLITSFSIINRHSIWGFLLTENFLKLFNKPFDNKDFRFSEIGNFENDLYGFKSFSSDL